MGQEVLKNTKNVKIELIIELYNNIKDMQYQKVFAKDFGDTCFAEQLLVVPSEPRMILNLLIKCGKSESGDPYKL